MQLIRMFFIFILTSFFSVSTFAQPVHHLITSYQDLLTSLQQGDKVRAVFNIAQCKMTSKTGLIDDASKSSGGLNFNVFSHYPINDGKSTRMGIATSVTMLVEHQELGPIYGYLRLRVFEDNSVDIDNKFYDPKTYAVEGSAHYACSLNDKSILLYDLDS